MVTYLVTLKAYARAVTMILIPINNKGSHHEVETTPHDGNFVINYNYHQK